MKIFRCKSIATYGLMIAVAMVASGCGDMSFSKDGLTSVKATSRSAAGSSGTAGAHNGFANTSSCRLSNLLSMDVQGSGGSGSISTVSSCVGSGVNSEVRNGGGSSSVSYADYRAEDGSVALVIDSDGQFVFQDNLRSVDDQFFEGSYSADGDRYSFSSTSGNSWTLVRGADDSFDLGDGRVMIRIVE